MNQPFLSVNNLTHLYAPGKGFSDVSFDLWPGEVLGIVGESGSGKTTLLKSISARLTPQQGEIRYENRSLYAMSEADRRRLLRTEWGVVHQHPLDGLRRQVSAGGNIGERLMATGARHYGDIRATAQKWLEALYQLFLSEYHLYSGIHQQPDHLFRRHAATFADCPQPGDASEAGVYG